MKRNRKHPNQMKSKSFILIIGSSTVLAILAIALPVFATQTPYKTICHHTPANQVTLNFQNQQSYNGHLGTPHSGQTYDTEGACQEPTNTPTPTIEVTPTITDCRDCVTPTPTVVQEVTPTATPEATLTPTTPPSPHGDGLSDGKSDGRSDGKGGGAGEEPQITLEPCRPGICIYK